MSPKRPKPKFFLDENFPRYTGKFLQSLGHGVEYATTQRRRLTDINQLVYATRGRAILLTTDQDFKQRRFPARRIKQSFGVVCFRSSDPGKKTYERITRALLKRIDKQSIHGQLIVASVDKIRVVEIKEWPAPQTERDGP